MSDHNWALPLLSHRSACLRYRVLTDLFDRPPDDPEVVELQALRLGDEMVITASDLQREDGSWKNPETSWMLFRLACLGFDRSHPVVAAGAENLFSSQRVDGSWAIPSASGDEEAGYDMAPLQTALPLIGLAAAGYATDPRAETAYDWLLDKRLNDGAWPTGLTGGVFGGVAGYRRLAHSRWGCRSNTTGALTAMSYHPARRRCAEARRAMDLLLGRETTERRQLGFESARALGFEPVRGFFTRFARWDPAHVLDLAARAGATRDDERIADLVEWILAA